MAIGDNNWERWRGEVDTRSDAMEEDLRNLFDWKHDHEEEHGRLSQRLTSVETKMLFFAALAAAAGAAVPEIIAAMARK